MNDNNEELKKEIEKLKKEIEHKQLRHELEQLKKSKNSSKGIKYNLCFWSIVFPGLIIIAFFISLTSMLIFQTNKSEMSVHNLIIALNIVVVITSLSSIIGTLVTSIKMLINSKKLNEKREYVSNISIYGIIISAISIFFVFLGFFMFANIIMPIINLLLEIGIVVYFILSISIIKKLNDTNQLN